MVYLCVSNNFRPVDKMKKIIIIGIIVLFNSCRSYNMPNSHYVNNNRNISSKQKKNYYKKIKIRQKKSYFK